MYHGETLLYRETMEGERDDLLRMQRECEFLRRLLELGSAESSFALLEEALHLIVGRTSTT
jgi:hypothetical protein